MSASLATVSYIAAIILFILSLGGLSHPETSRRGNLYGMIGMAIAVVALLRERGRPWAVTIVGVLAMAAAAGTFGIYVEELVSGGPPRVALPVLERVDLGDTCRNRCGDGRDDGNVGCAPGQHHASATPRVLVSDNLVAVVDRSNARHGGVGFDGCFDGVGIGLDEVSDLATGHESVRIVAVVHPTRQPRLPVRCEHRERVPTLGPP